MDWEPKKDLESAKSIPVTAVHAVTDARSNVEMLTTILKKLESIEARLTRLEHWKMRADLTHAH